MGGWWVGGWISNSFGGIEVIFVLLLMRVWGFLTVWSGEVVSVRLFLMSDVWGDSNSVGSGEIASCCTCEGGGLVGGCHW